MGQTKIEKAEYGDLPKILALQYLAYQSEAALLGDYDIPPLKQTLDDVIAEYKDGLILKMVDDHNVLMGSIRAKENNGTVYVGKLMVHPDYQHQGNGTKLLTEIERYFPGKRYELFTSKQSVNNIRLYEKVGYRIFNQNAGNDHLTFVYMEKE